MKETESKKKARKEGGSVDLWVGGKKERGGVIIMGGVGSTTKVVDLTLFFIHIIYI